MLWRFLLYILLMCGGIFPTQALTILTEQWPPMNFKERGQLKGLSVEIVQKIQLQLKDTTPIKLMNWSNAYKIALEKPEVLLFSTSLTEKRMALFTFVGPLAVGSIDFYSLNDYSVPIETLTDAKHVKRIGVYYSAVEQQRLIELGFTNIVSVRTPEKAAMLLLKKRVDLWCNINLTYHDILRQGGYSSDKVKKRLTIAQAPLYLAFSKGTDPNTIKRWKNALIALHQSGEFKLIYQKYLPNEAVPNHVEQIGLVPDQKTTMASTPAN